VNKKYYTIATLVLATVLIKKLFFDRKTKTIKGSYQVPQNLPNRVDALHAFESRKSDGFGGKMSTQINAALRQLYNKGINPDLKKLDIKIDPVLFKVDWSAEIGPSTDGIAYVGMITRGSAGSSADERAVSQLPELTKKLNAKIVKDLNFNKGLKIRQFFYKYSLENYPNLK
jgi:hypothetical protein